MLRGSVKRDLRPSFSPRMEPLVFKMAAVTHLTAQLCTEMEEDSSTIAAQASQQIPTEHAVSIRQESAPSPASMESLIGHTMEDFLFSPMRPDEAYPTSPSHHTQGASDSLINTADLFNKLSELLDKGLSTVAAKIIGDIKENFQRLRDRMETMEHKLEDTVAKTNQNSAHIQVLQDQLDEALSKIDDLENRSRRYNFRLRGLLESVTDIRAAVHDLFKVLIPDIPAHKMELDRAHRALGPPEERRSTKRHSGEASLLFC